MDCPVCKDKAMITLELNEVEVDYCLDCKGIWLDEGELEILLSDEKQARSFIESFETVSNCDEKLRKCPICLKMMEKVSVVGDVVIDRCKKEHGIWFDKNELGDVLKHAELDPDNKVHELLKDIFKQK